MSLVHLTLAANETEADIICSKASRSPARTDRTSHPWHTEAPEESKFW
jgi:hypothetical protein